MSSPYLEERRYELNCVRRYNATTVTVAAGVTTIDIPETPVINHGDVFEITLNTPIPDETDGTQITITSGAITGDLMNGNGNYFRPNPLTSRTVFLVQYLSDPAHFQILRVYGSCCCGR